MPECLNEEEVPKIHLNEEEDQEVKKAEPNIAGQESPCTMDSKNSAVSVHIGSGPHCSPANDQEALLSSLPTVLLPSLPNLTGETQDWGELEKILSPKPNSRIILPEDHCCPITSRLMREPVTTSDGHTYEREAIEKWLEDHNTSPLAGAEPLESKKLTPVLFVKNAVGKLLDLNPELRDSKEWYLPESWVRELARACELGDEAAIRELVGRDRRLLVHTFDDTCGVHLGGKTALQLAVAASTHNKMLLVVVELLEQRKRGLGLAALLQEDSKRKGHVALHQAILARRDYATLLQIMSWMDKSLDLVSAPPDWPLLAEKDQSGVESKSELSTPALTQIQNTLNALLLWSVVRGDFAKVACLLRLRASPDVLNSEGQSVLYVAVEAVALQEEKGDENKKAEAEDKRTQLLMREQVIRLLLQGGANPNALNADGEHAPLHLALEKDLLATAFELVQTGHASLDLRLKDGTRPLHVVAGKATTELADALWGGGGDDGENIAAVHIPKRQHVLNSSGLELEATCGAEAHTPLHCAAKSGSIAMLHWLANRGAQLMAMNAKQQNILHVAASHNHIQFAAAAVRLVQEAAPRRTQALSSSVDCDGNTPLHLALARPDASDMVRWLLTELGALPPLRNRAGQLPRQVAESLGHMAVLNTYDDTVAMLRANDEVLAQQQGPLGELLLKLQRVIETQQARMEQQDDVIERQQSRLKQQEIQIQKLEGEIPRLLILEKESLDAKDFRKLQRHVVCGEYKLAEVIIVKNPNVLLHRGHIIDLSKRTFNDITVFQYALWALDCRMWQMMLKYLSKEEACVQRNELDARGTEHGAQFTNQRYYDTFQNIGRSTLQFEFQFQLIARAQRLLPVHVLRELAEPNFRSAAFDQTEPFTTERSFQQWYEDNDTIWLHSPEQTLLEIYPWHAPNFFSLTNNDCDTIRVLLERRSSQRISFENWIFDNPWV